MKPKNPEQRKEQYKAMCQDMVKPIMLMQMINMERLTADTNEKYAQKIWV